MDLPIVNNTDNNFILYDNQDLVHYQNIEQLKTYATDSIKVPFTEDILENNSSKIEKRSKRSNSDNSKLFLNWRNNNLDSLAYFCKITPIFDKSGIVVFRQQLEMVLRCMVHLTKRLCKYDSKCINDSFNDFNFDINCIDFDLNNIISDDKYIEGCKNYNFRPVNGGLKLVIWGKNLDQARYNFFSALYKLCHDTTMFNEAKFSAYDLRDECLNDVNCLVKAMKQNLVFYCTNRNFMDQFKKITQILDIKLKIDGKRHLTINRNYKNYGRKTPSIEEIPNVTNVSFFENVNDFENHEGKLLSIEEIPNVNNVSFFENVNDFENHGRKLLSIEEIPNVNNVYSFEDVNDFKLINSTEIKDFDMKIITPITVIGIMLISLLGYYSVKNKKKTVQSKWYLAGSLIIMILLIVYLISSIIFD